MKPLPIIAVCLAVLAGFVLYDYNTRIDNKDAADAAATAALERAQERRINDLRNANIPEDEWKQHVIEKNRAIDAELAAATARIEREKAQAEMSARQLAADHNLERAKDEAAVLRGQK